MLIINILWIIIGIVVLIYQAFKEKPKTSLVVVGFSSIFLAFIALIYFLQKYTEDLEYGIIFPILLTMGVGGFIYWICKNTSAEDSARSTHDTITIVIGIVVLIYVGASFIAHPLAGILVMFLGIIGIGLAWLIDCIYRKYIPEKEEVEKIDRTNKWRTFLAENGYSNITNDDIFTLVYDSNSPINSEKLNVTVQDLVSFLGRRHSNELNNMSDEKLEAKIGNVPIDTMPLDRKMENVYYAKKKIRALIISRILKEEYGGLEYYDFLLRPCPYSTTDEYAQELYSYIDRNKGKFIKVNDEIRGDEINWQKYVGERKVELKKFFADNGYPDVEYEDLELVICEFGSPLRRRNGNKYVKFDELYKWLCHKRESKKCS